MNERSIAMQMGEEEKNKIHEDYLLMRTEEEEEEKRGEEEEKGKEEEGEEEKEKEEKMEFEEDDINIVSAKFEKMVIWVGEGRRWIHLLFYANNCCKKYH